VSRVCPGVQLPILDTSIVKPFQTLGQLPLGFQLRNPAVVGIQTQGSRISGSQLRNQPTSTDTKAPRGAQVPKCPRVTQSPVDHEFDHETTAVRQFEWSWLRNQGSQGLNPKPWALKPAPHPRSQPLGGGATPRVSEPKIKCLGLSIMLVRLVKPHVAWGQRLGLHKGDTPSTLPWHKGPWGSQGRLGSF
jgi:hypothetical protein